MCVLFYLQKIVSVYMCVCVCEFVCVFFIWLYISTVGFFILSELIFWGSSMGVFVGVCVCDSGMSSLS